MTPGFDLEFERRRGQLHRRRKRGLAGRVQRVDRVHDRCGRVPDRLEVELDIALVVRPGPVGDEPDLAELGGLRQHLRQSDADLVDARLVAEQALDRIAGHGPRRIEDDHRVLGAVLPGLVVLLRGRRAGEERDQHEGNWGQAARELAHAPSLAQNASRRASRRGHLSVIANPLKSALAIRPTWRPSSSRTAPLVLVSTMARTPAPRASPAPAAA